jgi:hypothetical protein
MLLIFWTKLWQLSPLIWYNFSIQNQANSKYVSFFAYSLKKKKSKVLYFFSIRMVCWIILFFNLNTQHVQCKRSDFVHCIYTCYWLLQDNQMIGHSNFILVLVLLFLYFLCYLFCCMSLFLYNKNWNINLWPKTLAYRSMT